MVEQRLAAAKVAKAGGRRQDEADFDELVEKCAICFKAEDFERAIDYCIELAVSTKPDEEEDVTPYVAHNLASALHHVRMPCPFVRACMADRRRVGRCCRSSGATMQRSHFTLRRTRSSRRHRRTTLLGFHT